MKIPLINYGHTKLFLHIEKKFISPRPIIPLGCDCHPAYVLKSLNLRKQSYPFDWLNTIPSGGIAYVNKNIKEGFKYFVRNLVINERGYIVSTHYINAEFFHYRDLIDNQLTQNKLSRRSKRFLDYFNNKPCTFLFNITSGGLKTSSDVSLFLNSVKEFHELSSEKHELLVYIRYDENLQENQTNCGIVRKQLRIFKNTRIVNYFRHKKDYGVWGDESKYTELFESLELKLKLGFPKVYLSKSKRG